MSTAHLSTWEEVGARVAAARQLAGFTQHELATRLGLSRSAVTRIELGQRHLDLLELARLADALGRTVAWFLTPPPRSIASHRTSLSSDQDVRRLEDALEQLSRDVELLVELDAVRLPPPSPQLGITRFAEAEARASETRAKLGLEDGPIYDLQRVVERLGLLAFSLDLGSGVIDGGYARLDKVGVALVNGAVDPGRRRFTLAHELGHHVVADEYTTDFGLSSASKDDREALINAFAVHFLMPASSVRRRWDELRDEWPDQRTRLVILAAEYRVSWSAMLSHAVTLKLIAHHQYSLFESQRPTRADYYETGCRFEEELAPVSLAPAFSQAVIRAFRRSVISNDRAVELLRGTLTLDDLPAPRPLPMEALKAEFEDLHNL